MESPHHTHTGGHGDLPEYAITFAIIMFIQFQNIVVANLKQAKVLSTNF